MESVLSWLRSYCILFYLLSLLLTLSSKKTYRQDIRFLVELILVIAILKPFFQVFHLEDNWKKNFLVEDFFQEISNLKYDSEKLTYDNNEHIVSKYEQIVETDVAQMVKEDGYENPQVTVRLNENYEIVSMQVQLNGKKEEHIIVGKIGTEQKIRTTEEERMYEKINAAYGLQEGVLDVEEGEGP